MPYELKKNWLLEARQSQALHPELGSLEVWPSADVLLEKQKSVVPSTFFEDEPYITQSESKRSWNVHTRNIELQRAEIQISLCKALLTSRKTTAHRHPPLMKTVVQVSEWWTFHPQKEGRGVHLFVCAMGRRKMTTMSNACCYMLSKSKTLLPSSALRWSRTLPVPGVPPPWTTKTKQNKGGSLRSYSRKRACLLIIRARGGRQQLKNLCVAEKLWGGDASAVFLLCRRERGKGGEGAFRQLYHSKRNQRGCS